MPGIWSEEWYEAMLEMAGSRDDLSAKVPRGEWRVAVEVEGDGKSPYIPAGEVRHFLSVSLTERSRNTRNCRKKSPVRGCITG